MALSAAALADYTQGRLGATDPETAKVLARALAEVQRWCGWHVAPAAADVVVVLDGPGGPLLRLPTLRLVGLAEVTEGGVELDVAELEWSANGLVRKASGAWWSSRFGAITVKMTHGFATADDFEAAVLSVADRRSLAQAATGGAPTAVGPFRWGEAPTSSAFTAAELSILELYRLEKSA